MPTHLNTAQGVFCFGFEKKDMAGGRAQRVRSERCHQESRGRGKPAAQVGSPMHSFATVQASVRDALLQTILERAMHQTQLRRQNFACSFGTLQCGISQ